MLLGLVLAVLFLGFALNGRNGGLSASTPTVSPGLGGRAQMCVNEALRRGDDLSTATAWCAR
jgi:hypothetical protein